MQNKAKVDYDETKKMLNTMRKFSVKTTPKTLLKKVMVHEVYQDLEDYKTKKDYDVIVINDVEVKITSSDEADMQLNDDQKKSISQVIDNFRQQVSQIVDFDPGFTIKEDQIRLDGTFTDQDIDFVIISGNESGIYLNAEMLKLDDETIALVDKLKKFEETFKTSMEPLITYRKNN